MSAYIKTFTPILEEDLLIEALCQMGFKKQHIEIHARPQPLYDFSGRKTSQTAEIIIRKKHVGVVSNDIGFSKTSTGYQLTLSDIEHGANWQNRLFSHYEKLLQQREEQIRRQAEESERLRKEEERKKLIQAQKEVIIKRAQQMNYAVKERKIDGNTQLLLVRRSY
jgi:hypothetical protein